jgi:replicative DNA helicase
MVDELTPLFNLEAEMSVLGSMLLSDHATLEMLEALRPKSFFRPAHRTIFAAIESLVRDGVQIDLVTVKDRLVSRGELGAVGGEDYLVAIATYVPSPANARYYAGIVQDKAVLRSLEDAGHRIVQIVHDSERGTAVEKLRLAEATLLGLSGGVPNQGHEAAVRSLVAGWEQSHLTGESQKVIPTPFYELSQALGGGFYGSRLYALGARTGDGKSAFLLECALRAARMGYRVLFLTTEMSPKDLIVRYVGGQLGCGDAELARAPTEEELNARKNELADLADLPLRFEYCESVSEVEASVHGASLRGSAYELVLVDYWQDLTSPKRARGAPKLDEYNETAAALFRVAITHDVPVLVAAQLNREVVKRGEGARPKLTDLGGSDALAKKASVVMLLYRDAEETGEHVNVEIHVRKNRSGPCPQIDVAFIRRKARFTSWQTERGGGAA